MKWLQLIDEKLGTNFDAPRYDPAVGRKKLVKVIDKAASQHSEGKTPSIRSWRTGGPADKPAISFQAKIDGQPVLLNGKETVFTPSERFAEFLRELKASVEAGELDKEIKAALESEGASSTSSRATRGAPGKPRQSKLPARADGLAHRVPAADGQPHESYTLNTAKSHWRSPEQVEADARSYAARGKK